MTRYLRLPVSEESELRRLDEAELLVQHRRGDPDAFAELVARYRAPVFSYLSRCGVREEDRRDLFQDVFVRIHGAAERYQADRPLHPWVFTIVANVVRNHHRRLRVRQLVFADGSREDGRSRPEPVTGEPGGERFAGAREAVAWVEREIRKLSRAQRQVLVLAAVEGLPLKQVATALGLPLNTVKTHLRRARLALIQARRDRGAPSTDQGQGKP